MSISRSFPAAGLPLESQPPISDATLVPSVTREPLLVPDLVSQHALLRPEATALVESGRKVTYAELNSLANRLVELLHSLQVGREVVVGLCMTRGPAMVVAMLGVLKAGAAYLPLDPDSPVQRNSSMLIDAGVSIVVIDEHTKNHFNGTFFQTIALAHDGSIQLEGAFASGDSATPRPSQGRKIKGDDLAYVIYTSGSTGQPKGVEVTHSGLLNLVRWHVQEFAVTPSSIATQLANPAFDAAVWELWPYLSAGAAVHMPDNATRIDPERLRDWLIAQAITISFVPTPIAEQLVRLPWPSRTALRTLLTGADTLHQYPPSHLPFTLVNNYGPTECTVVATSGRVPPNEGPTPLPTIGKPIANTKVYILDAALKQVENGTSGEMYIGGVGVARGYRNRPALTAERFIPDPFSSSDGARLYKTGDLARYLPDGEIAFIGRSDEQVKVRGYRIEPNDIVVILDRHPAVRASAVIAREDTPGDKRLVAYVLLDGCAHITAAVLRDFVAAHLPDYMVPTVFVRLESLPLTSNGKVNRAALPPPADHNVLEDRPYVAPRTPVERTVSDFLTSLLRINRVGVHDNFFLLGGDSLLGAQVIARVRDNFGVELGLLRLFDHPTVADISAEIEQLLVEKVQAMSEQEVQQFTDSTPDQLL